MKRFAAIALVIVSVLLMASVGLAENKTIPGGPGVMTINRLPVAK